MNISIPLFQRGANKVPIYALIVIILDVLLFVFVGDVSRSVTHNFESG
jgi:hypothetical protein